MAEPFYRVGEPRGPFFVVADSFEVLPSGRTVETVVDSGRNRATTYGWDDDREYYQICQRQGDVLVPYTIRHQKTEAGAATPEIFAEFAACPHLWCTFKYSNHSDADAEAWKYGILGCTRFRKNLMRKLPDVVKNLEWRYRDWHVMSTGLGMALRKQRFEPHVHGVVDHHRMMDLGGVAELMAS